MFKKISSYIRSLFTKSESIKPALTSEKIGYGLLSIAFIIGPIFFLTSLVGTITTSKSVLFCAIAGLLIILYAVTILIQGKITLPRERVFMLLGGISLVTIISSLFSGHIHHSFFGYAGEISSGIFIIVFSLFIFFSSRFIQSFEKISTLYMGFISVSSLLIIYHTIRFFIGAQFLNFGIIPFSTGTLVGSWNDLAILLGAFVLLVTIFFEFTHLKRVMKMILGFFGILALLMLLIINFKLVWIIIAVVACLVTLYTFSFAYWDFDTHTYKKESRIPKYTLVLFIIAISAIVTGGIVSNYVYKYNNLSYTDVRPSIVTTTYATGKSIAKNFVVGTGSNSFNSMWQFIKPQNISGTKYGSSTFELGYGNFPTFMATHGALGIILWVLFFVVLILRMSKVLTKQFNHPQSRFFLVSLATLILYLLVFGFVYTMGISLMVILAILIGVFFGVSSEYGATDEREFAFIKDPRTSFFGIIAIIIIILIGVFSMYTIVRKYISLHLYQAGSLEYSNGQTTTGLVKINQALNFSDNDIFHRELSRVATGAIEQFLGDTSNNNLSKEQLSNEASRLASIAISHAESALNYNRQNAQNWINQGDVYRFMARLGISGAYDKAIVSYRQAQKLNPHDTTMDLYFAQLEIANGNTDQAKQIITNSINKQPTRDAYLLNYQIYTSQKKTDSAIAALIAAINLDPNNPDLYYEYGTLAFKQAKYTLAANLFNQVLNLNRSSINSYFYLALSLEKSGNTEQANQVIDFLRKNNTNTDTILNQLRNSIAPAISAEPEPAVAETPKKQ